MARPRLASAITWTKFEQAVLALFAESLRRLASRPRLPQGEEPINFELFRICVSVHFEQLKAKGSIPFFILFDSTNQPEPDDTAESRRLKKRPDFACVLTNEQAADAHSSRIIYCLECKRLGKAEANWVLNENYSERGMCRFVQSDHSYAKGCCSATMVGYMQNMDPEDVLSEVNRHSITRRIPSLTKASTAWETNNVTRLSNRLIREFSPDPLDLYHLWIDLRNCQFERALPKPAAGLETISTKKSDSKKIKVRKSRKST